MNNFNFEKLYNSFVTKNEFNRSYQLTDLVFRQRAGYNDMYMTPMQADFSNRDKVNYLRELTDRGCYGGSEFAYLSHQLVKPKLGGNSYKTNIANGWGESRAMFIMTVESNRVAGSADSYFKHVFVGFTDHFNVREGDTSLPMDMKLTFNHVFTFRCDRTINSFGSSSINSSLISSHQIFSTNYGEVKSFRNNGDKFGVRPSDVYANIRSSGMMEGVPTSHTRVIDGRVNITSKDLKSPLMFSDMANNNNPSTYLAKIMRAMNKGLNCNTLMEHEVYREDRIMDECWEEAKNNEQFIGAEDTPANQFLDDLCKNFDYKLSGYIYFSNIVDFFGDRVDQVLSKNRNSVSVIPSKNINTLKNHIRGMGGFGGKTKQTEIATILAYSVPTYMMRCGILEYGFISTNDVRTSTFSNSSGFVTRPLVSDDGGGFGSLFACQIRMFDDSFDTRNSAELLHSMIENELLRSVSKAGQVKLTVKVSAALCGDIVIKVKWQNDPEEEFIQPAFCDNIFGLMGTRDIDDLHMLSSSVFSLSDRGDSGVGDSLVNSLKKEPTLASDIDDVMSFVSKKSRNTFNSNQGKPNNEETFNML